ncbi:MAG: hypothetical protein H7Z14_21855, partial [Anaerolineae bacterium]|nr:hypothetical protein [Phycisphaerae bacterium]
MSVCRSTRTIAILALAASASIAHAQQSSEPAMLQWFEASQKTIEKRSADLFRAGYGGIWVPPMSRSEDSNSVGYNVYDRFDLGQPNDTTLYGTTNGFKSMVNSTHKAGGQVFFDLILNHSGFRDNTTTSGGVRFSPNPNNPAQLHGGGYPGFVMSTPTLPNGEYHPANVGTYSTNPLYDQQFRIAGLNDLDQRVELMYVRNPVPGNPDNIPNPANATIFGRQANVPNANNYQFYPDTSLPGRTFTDPRTGGSYTVYPYNTANPAAGDAVKETAMGYLMRNAQWMVQTLGVDGFRIDTAKHVYPFVLDYYDRGVFRQDLRTNLDGSQRNVFSFLEYYDGNAGTVNSIVRKDIVNGSNTVGGNRDALDFPLFFAMRDNLGATAANNNWHRIRNASVDGQDGNANDGTRGVSFVTSHDDGGMTLSNVAHAFTLMRPGKALVYTNAHEFGARSFPQDGRTDALGGFYGNTIAKLVDIRNTHGRGNFAERWLDDAFNPNGFSNVYIYERQNSAVVALNSAFGNTVDTRNGVQTSFAAGTHLVELTGNADDPAVDVNGTIPNTLVVNASGQINVAIPRNTAANKGYVIYGLQNPKGAMSLSNVASTLAGETLNANTNGTARINSIDVITANTFNVNLNTLAITLPDNFRDKSADGDRAYVKIDEGLDLNNTGTVDFRTPGSTRYGFEDFTGTNLPGYNQVSGNGTYSQSISAANLSEGYHYITTRAFRQRSDGGPDVFSDFKRTIYVDRLKPVAAVSEFSNATTPLSSTRDLKIKSVDQTATQVNVFVDLAANLTDSQILGIVSAGNQATMVDRDLFTKNFTFVGHGNHAITIVTKEITGNTNIQRIAGVFTQTTRGAGLGDLDFDGVYEAADVTGPSNSMEQFVYPDGTGGTNFTFNAAADINADGLLDSRDLYGQRDRFRTIGAPAAATNAAVAAVLKRGDVNQDGFTTVADIDHLHASFGNTAWRYDLDVDGWPTPSGADRQDADVLIRTIFETDYGDSDLNGIVDFDDYSHIDNGFNNNSTGWANGDFDGNGVVDFDDYSLIDLTFNNQSRGVARAMAYLDGSDPSSH